ncbi:SRPBCC domain-containing protein [Kribbella sp. NPDC051952]|uniref:SRPBCC family protein n=1 Tax=Kribbella sp. NPDC051952 TaxID=3154851 RepID=UPI003417864E
MRLEHSFVVPAPVEQVWAAFNDLERVVPCFPGATLTGYDGDAFTGSVKVKLGPVSLQYSGTGSFLERDPDGHHALIEAKGKDRRGNGTATARVTARLTASGPDSTDVTVDTDLTITGRPAQFGRGLIQDVSNQLLDKFTTCLTTKLEPPTKPAEPAERAEPAEPAVSPEQPAAPEQPAGPEQSGAPDQSAAPEKPASPQGPASPGPPAGSAQPAAGAASPRAAADAPPAAAAELDLGSTLLPVLARRVAPYLIGAAVALLLRRLFSRS